MLEICVFEYESGLLGRDYRYVWRVDHNNQAQLSPSSGPFPFKYQMIPRYLIIAPSQFSNLSDKGPLRMRGERYGVSVRVISSTDFGKNTALKFCCGHRDIQPDDFTLAFVQHDSE